MDCKRSGRGVLSLQGWASSRRLVLALFAIAFLALPGAASATYSSELKRYPYLTDVVGDSATVNWGTTRLSNQGVLKYGEVATESCTAHTVATTRIAITVGTVSEYQWKAQLSGLSPNTEYCYRLYLGSSNIDLLGNDPSPRFKSQVPSGSSAPYSFAVFGDWGYVGPNGTNPDQATVMQQIASSGARFAITTGDNAYQSGSQLNYGDLVQTGADTSGVFGPNFWTVAGSSIPLFPTMGNHGFSGATTALNTWPQDRAVATSNGRYVRETYCCLNGTTSADYPSMWYAFDAGNARFYVLEAAWTSTNPGTSTQYGNDYAYHWTPDSAEYKWLQNDLATNTRPLKFAFFHYPLYSDNPSENSDTWLQGPDSLEGLLSRYGVDTAFSGHAHSYQRFAASGPDGLPSYATGGGGANIASIANCDPLHAYGIGWSDTNNIGSACGAASVPTDRSQVFHFIRVDVSENGVQIIPTDSLGRTFDVQSYSRTAGNSDLSITSSDAADPVLTGGTVTYTLNVQNSGPDDASGVVVTDELPADTIYESATPSQGTCSQLSGTVTCKLGAIASSGSATVEVKLTAPSDGSITNKATVVGDDLNDPSISNNSTSESTTVTATADLSITKSDSPDPVAVGDTLTYTLSVHNAGSLDATNVTVTDNLPSNVTYQSATPSQGTCSENGGTVTCALGDLANGADATVDIAVTVDSTDPLTNTASVQGDQVDDNEANNTASQDTTVVRLADLSINKSDSPDPVAAGQTLTYTLTVTNNGPSDAPSATATDYLPSGVTYQSATPSQGSCSQASGTVTCDLGAIGSGGSATVEIKVTPPTVGTITNTASVVGNGSIDPNSANDTASAVTVVGSVTDLSVTNADSPDPATVGKTLTYAIKVRNNGPSNATGVTLTDPLPASVNFVSATAKKGTCFQSVPGTVLCSIGSIGVGASVDLQIKVTPQLAGTLTNTATVQSNQFDSNQANDSASATTTVNPSADLAIAKSASPSTPFVGNAMTYTLAIQNNGPSPATGVTVTDPLPTGYVAYQSVSSSQGSCSQSAGKVTCALGSLAVGGTASATINVTAIRDGGTDNKASVKGNEGDPVGGNNSSTVHSDISR